MAARRKYADEHLIQAVPKARSIAQVLLLIGLRPAGGNYKTVKYRIRQLGLDTSHFGGQAWLKGTKVRTRRPIPLQELLVDGSRYQSFKLKRRLIEEGLKEARCESCGLLGWNGEPLPLELDHINGRNDDNRLMNLRILCPNCHALTSTYRGRNKGRI
jgi:hypothetical protein